jgi:hypothetical protein
MDINQQLLNLNDQVELEAFGKTMSSDELLIVLNIIADEPNISHKLKPIIAGISQVSFYEMLHLVNNKELSILQQQSMSIPLQYQLTMLSIQQQHLLNEISKRILIEERFIQNLTIENCDSEDFQMVYAKVEEIASNLEGELQIINSALSLAWNTDRIDLIDKFNFLKESCQKIKILCVGDVTDKPKSISHHLGLYAQLNQKLDNVYADEIFSDEEISSRPALEALVKLSIVSLEDYLKCGLFTNVKITDSPSADLNETESEVLLNKYLNLAKDTLASHGLTTIADLKLAHIYSRKALINYLSK